MAAYNYDPSTHRKALPPFPNVFSTVLPAPTGAVGSAFVNPKYGAGYSNFKPGFQAPAFPTQQNDQPSEIVPAFPAQQMRSQPQEAAWPVVDVESEETPIDPRDRYQARKYARAIQSDNKPGSPMNIAARDFRRIDGRAPLSSRDTTPAPVNFAGRILGGRPSVDFDTSDQIIGGIESKGFGAKPQDTAKSIRGREFGYGFGGDAQETASNVRENELGFPSYGALRKKYQFPGG